jgi:lantibiotic leader peptide-processing serine protease
VGRIISQNDFITIWRHLFVFYSAGNEVTGSPNLHEKPVTIPFTLADARFPVNAAQKCTERNSMHRFTKLVVTLGAVIALLSITQSPRLFATSGVPVAHAATAQTYIVLYQSQAVPADAASTIAQAGGTLVYSYPQIGVVIASSDNTAFRGSLMTDSRIDGVSATSAFATKINDGTVKGESSTDANGPPPGNLPNSAATDHDTLSPLQWDMRQIHTPEAHAITGGSPLVTAGDIDTGLDFNHPDLKQNVDFADSVSCIGGVPNQDPAAWKDDNGHGTHTAGTIAAASNGIGIVGVAPNVKIAGIKAGDAAGFFFPEAVVCAFVWAGTHHIDVTNNSYFADPFLYNCRNDPVQRAIWKAEQRAILFAQQQGVTVVAAAGNESEDISHPTQDLTSPDNTTPVPREVTNACVVIPVEIPGVIGVSADGHNRQDVSANNPNGTGYLKSFYSSFGVSAVEVVAPGGDSVFGRNAEAPNGRVLSTWPSYLLSSCLRPVIDPSGATYCYLQGTSMASPHVAGVAALIISRYGNLNNPQNGKLSPGQVQALIQQTADPQPCPQTLPPGYSAFVGLNSGLPQTCQGGTGHNSWYGNGQVNAFNAVTHTPGQ